MRTFPVWAFTTFDPGTIAWTGWWRASYTAPPPWTGTASVGTSGTRDLTEGALFPSTGPALNGLTTADFEIGDLDRLSTSTDSAVLFSVSSGTILALVKPESVRADQADAFNESAVVMSDPAFLVMALATSGLRGAVFDGAWKTTAYQAAPVGSWSLLQMRWNGVVLETRVGGAAWSSVAVGNITGSGTVYAGFNSVAGAVALYDGELAELMTTNLYLADAQIDAVRGYMNSRYGLSI